VGPNTWRFQSNEDLYLAITLDIIQTFLLSHGLWEENQ
jgi:hypothetical protein